MGWTAQSKSQTFLTGRGSRIRWRVRRCGTSLPYQSSTELLAGQTSHIRQVLGLIKRSFLMDLNPGEIVHADQGYQNCQGEPWLFIALATPVTMEQAEGNKVSCVCQKSINGRFKRFCVLSSPFWHELEKHGLCFRAFASLVQLTLTVDETVFWINYTE